MTDTNYSAVVVRIETLNQLPGLDNLRATKLLGYDVLVGKSTQVGDVGVLFVAETQLSESLAKRNNLYRHEGLNADT